MFKCQNVKLITVYCPGGFAGCALATGAVGCAPDTGAPIPALYPSGFLTWTFSVLSSLSASRDVAVLWIFANRREQIFLKFC